MTIRNWNRHLDMKNKSGNQEIPSKITLKVNLVKFYQVL